MNETWYEIKTWDKLITPVTVVSQTDKMVTIIKDGRKITKTKISNYTGYFKTIEDAKKHIYDYFKNKVISAESALEHHRNKYAKIVEELKKY